MSRSYLIEMFGFHTRTEADYGHSIERSTTRQRATYRRKTCTYMLVKVSFEGNPSSVAFVCHTMTS